MQEKLSDCSFLPKSRPYVPRERCSSCTRGQEHSHHERLGVDVQTDLDEQTCSITLIFY